LNRNNQHFRIKRQELLDGKLLNLSGCVEKLIEGIFLLLKVQVRKLFKKQLLVFLAKLIQKLLWMR